MYDHIKQSLKVFSSIMWRAFIVVFAYLGLAYIFEHLFAITLWQISFESGILPGFVILLPLILVIAVSYFILNQLPSIHYSDIRVSLMKGIESKKFGVFDTLCFLWSWTWRYWIVRIGPSFLLCIFVWTDYGLKDSNLVLFIESIYPLSLLWFFMVCFEVVFSALAFIWLMHRKKSGRYISVETLRQDKPLFKNV